MAYFSTSALLIAFNLALSRLKGSSKDKLAVDNFLMVFFSGIFSCSVFFSVSVFTVLILGEHDAKSTVRRIKKQYLFFKIIILVLTKYAGKGLNLPA
ncbi:hypothetical protein [Pedobacter sp.]|uniref:hypothetical protein n=1 Tax=Pedobacter sp. TaxID=1411316 RepID=UPI003BACD00D